MLAAVRFKNFKALRATAVQLAPFNLVLGPNGSGKTSLIQALLRLRTLAALPSVEAADLSAATAGGPEIEFTFAEPWQDIRVTLGCSSDELVCNLLVFDAPPGAEQRRAQLRQKLQSIRAYLFDHYAMAVPVKAADSLELSSNGGNLAAVLAGWQAQRPEVFAALQAEFCRMLPEFAALELTARDGGLIELGARLVAEGGHRVAAGDLSQGTLYLLAILALAYTPDPPAVVCLEEADRGMHPRTLRAVRDSLYRLSYPKETGMERPPVQVITTTHSPYFLDQFREHPEEVVLASKHGAGATFERLSDRTDLLELMKETHLGDLWYSGILGGVPGE
jgi:predicted ATPase